MVGETEIKLPKVIPDGVIGVVASKFNWKIVDKLLKDFNEQVKSLSVIHSKNHTVDAISTKTLFVPGALEIPHGLRLLVKEEIRPLALVALGCVIKGETYHFEVVSNISAAAVMKVNEDTGIPVINGILTCYTKAQATERATTLGESLARSALYMASLINNE